jgi:hypothetical protein
MVAFFMFAPRGRLSPVFDAVVAHGYKVVTSVRPARDLPETYQR